MKFAKYNGSDIQLEKGKIYRVTRRTLGGCYILNGVEGKFPKEDFLPVKIHEGTTIYMPKIGESFACACYENRQKIEYQTSAVTDIIHNSGKQYTVFTQNSVYIVFVLLD